MRNIVSKEPLRQFGGKIVGWLERDRDGNEQLRDFGGRIIATYDAAQNKSREFGGRIIGDGNIIRGLAFDPKYNKRL